MPPASVCVAFRLHLTSCRSHSRCVFLKRATSSGSLEPPRSTRLPHSSSQQEYLGKCSSRQRDPAHCYSQCTMQRLLTLLLCSGIVSAQDVTVPSNAVVLQSASGRGVQIYECTRQGNRLQWTFKAPEATLVSPTGATVGSHDAGPTWTWNDGSAVRGTLAQTKAAPNAGSIPWLLLSASAASETPGVLSHVTWVRRSATQGGVAPEAGCAAGQEHERLRVPYSATYTFYTDSTQP